ncbi:MAG TPA: nucleotidyltransferase family protein [Mycobacteriales bacterium]|nr:nucleotidyltransferase family protein [Mycobacteriales bacterium]
MTVAGLLLAAGAGRRFGGPKALVELDGELLVRRGVRLLRDGGCDPVLVVLGAAAGDVRPHVRDADVVVAHDWAEGMGASLRAGLAALADTAATACVVALVDQPLVQPGAVRALARTDGPAAVATYDGQPRNPVLLSREVWADVAATASGDTGARGWLRAHPEQVTHVPCDGSAFDVDTPADLSALHPRETA